MRCKAQIACVALPHKQFATQQRARETMDKCANCDRAKYIYRGADPSKNMSFDDIVRALNRLDQSGYPLTGRFIALNAWK